MRKRCAWCRQFVKADTPLTCWRVRVPHPNQQRVTDQWNYWARYLCRRCATGIDTLWRTHATEEDVAWLRPEGLPPTDPRWQPPRVNSPLGQTAPYLMIGEDPHERVRL